MGKECADWQYSYVFHLGFFLPFITKRLKIKNILIFSVFVMLIMEILQLVLGSFDIDDLICNFIDILMGFIIIYIKNTFGHSNNRKIKCISSKMFKSRRDFSE